MTTSTAHRLGHALIEKAQLIDDEHWAADREGRPRPVISVCARINGSELWLQSRRARQIGGALLRKSDDADDFQLEHGMRAVKV